MAKYIAWFEEIGLDDVPFVGGKNASLGEMIQALSANGIPVPGGFAITAEAYSELITTNGLRSHLEQLLTGLDKNNIEELARAGQSARALIKDVGLPPQVVADIQAAYKQLEERYGRNLDVAVRSSATAEDLPEASFAGQQETFLNIRGEGALLDACLACMASLFTDRAIAYRIDQGFDHLSVKLSVGVQKMVRSDLASSGVIFTLDPESGFRDVILVTSSYGLGENVVAGRVDPDEFIVFKPTLKTGLRPILRRKLGAKQLRMVYSGHGTRTTENDPVLPADRERFSLSDDQVLKLAQWALAVEDHYSKRYGKETAMDIEWALDGIDNKLYLVQARPETVHTPKDTQVLETYRLESTSEVLLKGRAIGERIGAGAARVIPSVRELASFKDGEVLVTDMTDPDWEPIMKRAAAIVTNRGGRTCHAAIVSREIGVPCVVGTHHATDILKSGANITVCCAQGDQGLVYSGQLPFSKNRVHLDKLPKIRTKLMLNLGNPEQALSVSQLPVDGVGLARLEFIIADEVKVHPLALTRFSELKDQHAAEAITKLTRDYPSREQYFIDKLAEGVAIIAAAFYPRPIIVRMSDFKTNEYANLLGGKQFEPLEENPMIGFRGACRYYDERYKDGFALECKALSKVRDKMGLSNVKVMIPFCRTPEEGRLVIEEMRRNGLRQGENGLEVYVMCELPSNVALAPEFAEVFDGFSIGSNDLTQLTLGLDRDNEIIARLFDERNDAVKRTIAAAIRAAKAAGKPIGICGQAPSDYPEIVKFLIEQEIDSISLTEDAVIKTLMMLAKAESEVSNGIAALDR